jgi:hypothetical protein
VRPTGDSAVLLTAATAAVRAQFRSGFRYAKAGAVLSDLRAEGQEQGELDLFASEEDEVANASNASGRARLMVAMDALNNRPRFRSPGAVQRQPATEQRSESGRRSRNRDHLGTPPGGTRCQL